MLESCGEVDGGVGFLNCKNVIGKVSPKLEKKLQRLLSLMALDCGVKVVASSSFILSSWPLVSNLSKLMVPHEHEQPP